MRKLPEEQIKAIQDKAKELMELVDKADCRLIAYLDGSERGIYNEKDDVEAESIDSDELQTTGIYGTVCNCEINSLYEEGECQDPYNF